MMLSRLELCNTNEGYLVQTELKLSLAQGHVREAHLDDRNNYNDGGRLLMHGLVNVG